MSSHDSVNAVGNQGDSEHDEHGEHTDGNHAKVKGWLYAENPSGSSNDLSSNDLQEEAEPYSDHDSQSLSSSASTSVSSGGKFWYDDFSKHSKHCSTGKCHEHFFDAVFFHAVEDIDTARAKLEKVMDLVGERKARRIVLWHDIQSSTFCHDLQTMIASACLIIVLVTKSLEKDEKAMLGLETIYTNVKPHGLELFCVKQGYGKGEPSIDFMPNMPECIDVDDDDNFQRSIKQRLQKARKKRSKCDEVRKKCEKQNSSFPAGERELEESNQPGQYPKDRAPRQSNANDSDTVRKTLANNSVNSNNHNNTGLKGETNRVPLVAGRRTNPHSPEREFRGICASENAPPGTQLTVEDSSRSSSSASGQPGSRRGKGSAEKSPDNFGKDHFGYKKKELASQREALSEITESSENASGTILFSSTDLPDCVVSDSELQSSVLQPPCLSVARTAQLSPVGQSEDITDREKSQLSLVDSSPSNSSQRSQPSLATTAGDISSTGAIANSSTGGQASQDEYPLLATAQNSRLFLGSNPPEVQTYVVSEITHKVSPAISDIPLDDTALLLKASAEHNHHLQTEAYCSETKCPFLTPASLDHDYDSYFQRSKSTKSVLERNPSVKKFASHKAGVDSQHRSEPFLNFGSSSTASSVDSLGSGQRETGKSEDEEQDCSFAMSDQKTVDTELNPYVSNKKR